MTDKKTGRILRSISGFYDVQTPEGIVTCRARGALRRGTDSPLTGDMVEITVRPSGGSQCGCVGDLCRQRQSGNGAVSH